MVSAVSTLYGAYIGMVLDVEGSPSPSGLRFRIKVLLNVEGSPSTSGLKFEVLNLDRRTFIQDFLGLES